MNEEPGSLQVPKIQTSSSGISLQKQGYTGTKFLSSSNLCISSNPVNRLRGHRDQITSIKFLSTDESQPSSSTTAAAGLLLTSSKDTFLKLWDLTTHHCIQTVVAHRSEVWSLDVNPDQDLIFSGSGEGEVKAWRIDKESLREGLSETETGEVSVRN